MVEGLAGWGSVKGVVLQRTIAVKRTRHNRLVLFVCLECEAAGITVCAVSWCLSEIEFGMEVQFSVLTPVPVEADQSECSPLL